MLRLTELRLPLDHAPDALRPAVCARLGLRDAELADFTVFRRGYDARRKTAIVLIYTIDLTLAVYFLTNRSLRVPMTLFSTGPMTGMPSFLFMVTLPGARSWTRHPEGRMDR